MKKHAAGLLIYRMKNGQPEVLIAHMGGPFFAKKDAGAWSIPKGEYEQDEDPLAAAKREFKEELGKSVPKGELKELGSIKYKSGKEVTAWAIEGDLDATDIKSNTFELEWPPRSGKMEKFLEIDRAEWFSLAEATGKLIPAQNEFLDRLAEMLGVETQKDPEPSAAAQASLF